MFDVGFAEIFLLSLIGLLVLGPERLPAVARTLGGFVRKARISYHNLKRTVEAELAEVDAANPLKEAKQELESVQREVKALGDKLSEDHTPSLTPTAADPEPNEKAEPTDVDQSSEADTSADSDAKAEAEAETDVEPAAETTTGAETETKEKPLSAEASKAS